MKKVSIKAEYGNKLAENGQLDEWQRSAHPYTVTVKYDGKQLTTPFFMGSALTHEPTEKDVLPALISSYYTVKHGEDFNDFCSNYGYDEDSRKAKATYKAVIKEGKAFQRVFGDDADKVAEKYWD